MNQKPPYSFHYFMFPFRFDKIYESFDNKYEYYQKYSFDKRVKKPLESIKDSLEKDNWEYKKFEIKSHLEYNELAYFYDFTKEVLFNTQEFKENSTSYYFEKKLAESEKSYIIEILKKENYQNPNEVTFQKKYTLYLDSISLRVFDTGIAILTYEVLNFDYKDIEDILRINDFGRRVYPQFLGEDFNLQNPKNTFLPNFTEVAGIKEDFNKSYKNNNSIILPKFITQILGENTFSAHSNTLEKFFIQPVVDDRMFVVSWYGNDEFSKSLKEIDFYKIFEDNKKTNWILKWHYNNWYRYIFVDGGDITVQNKYMQKELTLKASYLRWQNYGTFFGISRYSFVCLTNRDFFGTNIILSHMKSLYFQLFTILLAQRASIIRFSDEITAVINEKNSNELANNVSSLYKNYLQFRSKLFFKEVTAQEQGIEIYQQAKEIMEIENHLNETDSEIKSLNEYAKLEIEKKENKEMKTLSWIAAIFVPGTFVAGLAGMNVFNGEEKGKSLHIDNYEWMWGTFGVMFILTAIVIFLLYYFNKKDD